MRNVTISAAVSFDDYQRLQTAVGKTRLTISSYVALAIRQMLLRSPEEIDELWKEPCTDRKQNTEAADE